MGSILYRFPKFLLYELSKVAALALVFVGSMLIAKPSLRHALPTSWAEFKVEMEIIKSLLDRNLAVARGLAFPGTFDEDPKARLGKNPKPEEIKLLFADLQSQLTIITELKEKRTKQIRELELIANGKIPGSQPSDLDILTRGKRDALISIGECRRLAGLDP